MAQYRSGTIRIDISEVIEEIEDENLLEELHRRKLTPTAPGETVDLDILREAYSELNCNRVAEARVILERLLYPKWKSKREAQIKYDARLC